MAKPKKKPEWLNNAVKAIEIALQRLARSGGKVVVDAKSVRNALSRIPSKTLWTMAQVTMFIPSVLEDLKPAISKYSPIGATMVLEAVEAFLLAVGEGMQGVASGDTAGQDAARDAAATYAGTRIQAFIDYGKRLAENKRNFNSTAMKGLGDINEQARITRLVNDGGAMLLAATGMNAGLVTDMDLSSTENLRVFADAAERAHRARRAANGLYQGQSAKEILEAAAMMITPNDKVGMRVLGGAGKAVVGAVRDGVGDAAKWTGQQFMDKVWPVAQAQGKYTEPRRNTREKHTWWMQLWGKKPEQVDARGWIDRVFVPSPNWSFRESNIRMKFEWLAETFGGLLSTWAKGTIYATLGWCFCAVLMFLVGPSNPMAGIWIAGTAGILGSVSFIFQVVYAAAAIDLGRFLVLMPPVIANAIMNLKREDPIEFGFDNESVRHLRHIRWLVAYGTSAPPMVLFLFSMLVGPNFIAFALTAGAAIVAIPVTVVMSSFVKDAALSKRIQLVSVSMFSLLFAVGAFSLIHATFHYGGDTGLQFEESFISAEKSLYAIMYYPLPIVIGTLGFIVIAVATVLSVMRGAGMKQATTGVLTLFAMSFLLWYSADWFFPVGDKPLIDVPERVRVTLESGDTLNTTGSAARIPGQAVSPTATQDPWDASLAEDIGNF